MKQFFYIAILSLLSCDNNDRRTQTTGNAMLEDSAPAAPMIQESRAVQVCWRGTIGNGINVFLTYQVIDDIITGTITYLGTKAKEPIRVIGLVEEDSSYRILEFDRTGDITGIITGLPGEEDFEGGWFSPVRREELPLKLMRSDSVVYAEDITTSADNIAGTYHYQYTEAGYQGDIVIKDTAQGQVALSVFSVTGEPARNMAEIETGPISASTDFVYQVPDIDSCSFHVRVFSDFAVVRYVNGYCKGMFGFNATIEGIFYRQK